MGMFASFVGTGTECTLPALKQTIPDQIMGHIASVEEAAGVAVSLNADLQIECITHNLHAKTGSDSDLYVQSFDISLYLQ